MDKILESKTDTLAEENLNVLHTVGTSDPIIPRKYSPNMQLIGRYLDRSDQGRNEQNHNHAICSNIPSSDTTEPFNIDEHLKQRNHDKDNPTVEGNVEQQ